MRGLGRGDPEQPDLGRGVKAQAARAAATSSANNTAVRGCIRMSIR